MHKNQFYIYVTKSFQLGIGVNVAFYCIFMGLFTSPGDFDEILTWGNHQKFLSTY